MMPGLDGAYGKINRFRAKGYRLSMMAASDIVVWAIPRKKQAQPRSALGLQRLDSIVASKATVDITK